MPPPVMSKPSKAAHMAIAYVTLGSLLMVWSAIWYFWMVNHQAPADQPHNDAPFYWCAGHLLHRPDGVRDRPGAGPDRPSRTPRGTAAGCAARRADGAAGRHGAARGAADSHQRPDGHAQSGRYSRTAGCGRPTHCGGGPRRPHGPGRAGAVSSSFADFSRVHEGVKRRLPCAVLVAWNCHRPSDPDARKPTRGSHPPLPSPAA